ncbi:uncharacterized protein [Branchiostoma lanceolatum]|uniref:uncharacterized protein n=1 Tax=Branchiostoma lanceolatum TaxID=7740 RepID=UPI003454E9A1
MENSLGLAVCLLAIFLTTGLCKVPDRDDTACPDRLPRDLVQGGAEGRPNQLRQGSRKPLFELDLFDVVDGFIPNGTYTVALRSNDRKQPFTGFHVSVTSAMATGCSGGVLSSIHMGVKDLKRCNVLVNAMEDKKMKIPFRWEAPTCGCVTIRATVWVNNVAYYMEDEAITSGFLTKTICVYEGVEGPAGTAGSKEVFTTEGENVDSSEITMPPPPKQPQPNAKPLKQTHRKFPPGASFPMGWHPLDERVLERHPLAGGRPIRPDASLPDIVMKPSLGLHSGILGNDRKATPSAFAIPNPKCPAEILPRGMDLVAIEEICNATLLQKDPNFWDAVPERRRRPQESGRGLEWNVRLQNLGRRLSGGGSEEAGSRSQRHILHEANLQHCCQLDGLDRMMCFEFLRRAKMDEVCQQPFPDNDLIVFGIQQPCCQYTDENRYSCFDQVKYGYQRVAHTTDFTQELVEYFDKWEAFNALKNTQLQRPHSFTPAEVRHLCWRDRHWMAPEEPVGAARCAPFRNRTDSESVALKKEMIECCEDMESGRVACLGALRRKRLDDYCSRAPLPSEPNHPCCQATADERYECFDQEDAMFNPEIHQDDYSKKLEVYREHFRVWVNKLFREEPQIAEEDEATSTQPPHTKSRAIAVNSALSSWELAEEDEEVESDAAVEEKEDEEERVPVKTVNKKVLQEQVDDRGGKKKFKKGDISRKIATDKKRLLSKCCRTGRRRSGLSRACASEAQRFVRRFHDDHRISCSTEFIRCCEETKKSDMFELSDM